MSIVRATQTFHHAGGTVPGGTELDSADSVAQAFAPLFESTAEEEEPAKRAPGRPLGSRNKPKPALGEPGDG